jgi:hypothetical protein
MNLIALAALMGVVVLLFQRSALERRVAELEKGPAASMPAADGDTHQEEEHEEVEVAEFMGRLDRYHEKWWQAGKLGNAELAAFYLHEMEEAMEEIAEANVVEDGADVSAHMRTYGLPMVHQLEQRLKKDGVSAMHADADVLVNTCNSCHAACGFPFIRVRTPQEAISPGLDIKPL